MNNNIFPCLWFDGNAKSAADFYCQVFSNSKIITDTPMVVQFEIEGKKIMGLNGGPYFKINPSISLFITYETNEELERVHDKLLEGGSSLMPLDKYPWSEKYAWVADKFGMTWQLMLGKLPAGAQKITTSLLFVGDLCGKAQDAIKHYTSIFPNSTIHHLETYKAGEEQPEGNVKFGHFSLNNETFAAMDGTGDHGFIFNEGVSIMVEVDTQEEIDMFWNKLSEGGAESRCGWVKDKFSVSWQIVPKVLSSLVTSSGNGQKVMAALMQMGKIDIQTLVDASREPATV
ncbi:VOC family protein [Segetibacter aerophilus]|uniref:VOC family protein n=1 Tax=Segetibacter aerophilus TaxID=670293 RepID=A0A512BCZ8_9BACT|nr:VOC family protein [Segetibacter aerophilus]GEO09765.1 VOC family protein [Segetibacter aerophilus]